MCPRLHRDQQIISKYRLCLLRGSIYPHLPAFIIRNRTHHVCRLIFRVRTLNRDPVIEPVRNLYVLCTDSLCIIMQCILIFHVDIHTL